MPPQLDDYSRKDKLVTIKVNHPELEKLTELSKRKGMKKSTMARKALMEYCDREMANVS